jgi:SAM-dependent methyltransferase
MSIDSTAGNATPPSFRVEGANVTSEPATITARLLEVVGCDKTVLEITGEAESVAPLLTARRCRVVSIQPQANSRHGAEPYCDRVIVGDVELLDLEHETAGARFDVVLAVDVLTLVKDPWALLRKVARLLQPYGCVIATVPNFAHLSVRLSTLAGGSPYDGGFTRFSQLRFYTREVLVSLFHEAGFGIAFLDRHEEPTASSVPNVGALVIPDLVEALKKDPEASTSHFLITAHHLPSPAGDTLRLALNELRNRRETLEVDAAQTARTIAELRQEVERYQREIERQEDQVRALNAQALRRDEIVQSLSLQLDQHRAELSRVATALEASQTGLSETNAELDRHRVDVNRVTALLEQCRAEVGVGTERLEQARAETAHAQAELASISAELARERAQSGDTIAGQQASLVTERAAVASVRERACRVAAEAAALRDCRSLRVARWLRGSPDLWESLPAESALLKRDAIQYGFRRSGYALRESLNLQRHSLVYPLYPLPGPLRAARGVAIQIVVAVPGCGGLIGAELISPSNDVAARGTLSLDVVSDHAPTVIEFEPTDLGVAGWQLRVFVADSLSPVRILEFQRYLVPIQRTLARRPFCSLVV